MIFFALLASLLSAATAAYAEAQTLILSGFNNQAYFGEITRLAEKQSRREGRKTEKLEFSPDDGDLLATMRYGKPEERILKKIREIGADKANKDSLLLFINDHGDSSGYSRDPMETGIYLPKGNVFTNADMLQALQREIPKSRKVKIVATQCYAGGMHELAFRMPNVCVFAATSKDSLADYVPGREAYESIFLKALREGASPYEAQQKAALLDFFNEGRGQSSSAAYVDFVLKKGAYAPEGRKPPKNFTERLRELDPESFRAKVITNTIRSDDTLPRCENGAIPSASISRLLADVEALHGALSKYAADKTLPEKIRKDATGLSELWAKKRGELGRALLETVNAYDTLVIKYNSLSADDKRANVSDYARRFREMEIDAKARLGILWNLHMQQASISRVAEFYAKAEPAQKKKYEQLLACETERL